MTNDSSVASIIASFENDMILSVRSSVHRTILSQRRGTITLALSIALVISTAVIKSDQSSHQYDKEIWKTIVTSLPTDIHNYTRITLSNTDISTTPKASLILR